MNRKLVTVDGCTACAHVVHATNEMITIYPITPSSPVAEICDSKSAAGQVNIWGSIPKVTEMQSEAGAAGAVHGSLTTGAVTTTLTASQGLLLMIPDMYKIAGELTPTVFHVTARSVASQALCIFCDHSDVMAVRSTGFAVLGSTSVQEAMDFALISQAATLESRVPFVHFFDGFRTSHEIQKIEELTLDDMRAMINDDLVLAHRGRGLSPDRPAIRGTAQNPDVYFQGREAANTFYLKTPAIVQAAMDRFAGLTGRSYKLYEYSGPPDAETVVVIMGSASQTVKNTLDFLAASGQKAGLITVRLFRPFSINEFVAAIPASVKSITVLDRTKEAGAPGEPLYMDVRTAIGEAMEAGSAPFAHYPKVVGGRYGIGSKEFTPAMVKAVFDNASVRQPKNHFTVGITDDVALTSLEVDDSFMIEGKDMFRGMFFGLGSDGTVGANKNTIKIIGDETEDNAQGYFVYDSKKAGAMTVSHLRFGRGQTNKPYLLTTANFIACHKTSFLNTYDMLKKAAEGAVFLLTTSHPKEEVWDTLPLEIQQHLIEKKMRLFVIDAVALAEELGLGSRINMIMQTAFFVISNIIDKNQAVTSIKEQIEKTYRKKGEQVINMNYAAVDAALKSIVEVSVPEKATGKPMRGPVVPEAPPFVRDVLAPMVGMEGDRLPVSVMPVDGTWPTGTTQYEKRSIAVHVPVWEPDICIQCGLCSFVCPHATIRIKAYDPVLLKDAPASFKSTAAKGKELAGLSFTVQTAPEDCTGCGLCVSACPAHKRDAEGNKMADFKAINMFLAEPISEQEAENYAFFLSLPPLDVSRYNVNTIKGSQFATSLFEYHSACAGCGETPYIRLLTQLFGDRLLIANATGCSSIYGGNLPTIPYTKGPDGRGPAWSNSLFEDNAEFGLGMALTTTRFHEEAKKLLRKLAASADPKAAELLHSLLEAQPKNREETAQQRQRIEELKNLLANDPSRDAKQLLTLADYLIKKVVWAIGGDGWAYDIGYGGLDHVLASGEDINLLVLDTEVYSNTGGQMSKSTPLGAIAEFAAAGKMTPKKNLGLMMTSYGYIYVAQVVFGADPGQTLRALLEAESYKGPSLVVAYATCMNQGFDMSKGIEEMRKAVASGHWPLFRYNPDLVREGKNPLIIDSREPSLAFKDYAYGENRYRSLRSSNPELAAKLMEKAQRAINRRWSFLKHLAAWMPPNIHDMRP
jgi:pyruvate-ferredoxin/flavodoxin oxidoreductase